MIIIQQRTTVERFEHFLCYDLIDSPSSGYMFDCDENGLINPLEAAAAKASYADAQDTSKYYPPVVRSSRHTQRLPAIGRCDCGQMVQLADPLTNHCKCGKAYNMGGQEVNPNYTREDCVRDGWAWDSDY